MALEFLHSKGNHVGFKKLLFRRTFIYCSYYGSYFLLFLYGTLHGKDYCTIRVWSICDPHLVKWRGNCPLCPPCSPPPLSGTPDIWYVKQLLFWCNVNCKMLHFGILNSINQSLAHLVKVSRSFCNMRWSVGDAIWLGVWWTDHQHFVL